MTTTAAPAMNLQQSVLKLPAYKGEELPNAYLARVQLAAQAQGWSPEKTAVHVALSLEGEALQLLRDLLPHKK